VEEEVEEEEGEREETDSVVVSPKPVETEADDYEARATARKARRQRNVDHLSKAPSPQVKKAPAKTIPNGTEENVRENGTEEKVHENGTEEKTKETAASASDSYEARREARRKAREDRLKAAAANIDSKEPRISYRERKAREQLSNAKDNRSKWKNIEENSGDKEKAGPPPPQKKTGATQQLLAWCQHKTKFYENVEVKDFRQSWSNGLAFCAIMHSFLPDKIPYDDLTADDPRKNFTIAFEAAMEAGIPEMLDVDDMVAVKIPDSKSIMTFLVTIYQHFN
jgi:hypothetical protein